MGQPRSNPQSVGGKMTRTYKLTRLRLEITYPVAEMECDAAVCELLSPWEIGESTARKTAIDARTCMESAIKT